jgi:hypothetical protein
MLVCELPQTLQKAAQPTLPMGSEATLYTPSLQKVYVLLCSVMLAHVCHIHMTSFVCHVWTWQVP